jgi:hypothetical protein
MISEKSYCNNIVRVIVIVTLTSIFNNNKIIIINLINNNNKLKNKAIVTVTLSFVLLLHYLFP